MGARTSYDRDDLPQNCWGSAPVRPPLATPLYKAETSELAYYELKMFCEEKVLI